MGFINLLAMVGLAGCGGELDETPETSTVEPTTTYGYDGVPVTETATTASRRRTSTESQTSSTVSTSMTTTTASSTTATTVEQASGFPQGGGNSGGSGGASGIEDDWSEQGYGMYGYGGVQ